MDIIRNYITDMHQILDGLPTDDIEKVIAILRQAQLDNKQVFIMGNGGSATTASHFVCDLAKNTRRKDKPYFRVIGLADNMASFSAYANDEGYENVFAQQLAGLAQPGDVAIAISTSGNSPNIIRAVELARERGIQTIGFTGFNGGKLIELTDVNVHIASNCIERVEDVHLMLEHMICKALRDTA